MVLSMRLHALVFSACHGVPLVGAVYDPKVSSFLDSVGQDLYLPLEELEQEPLLRMLDRAAARIGDRTRLEADARRLMGLERKNLLWAKKLLDMD
jgi:polysaccharide pyruvyl transferase WcaK-like protein